MNSLNFQLVTPEHSVLSQELVSLSCPTPLGQITILPNHAPLVATLVPGELHARSEKGDFYIHVAGGFVQVKPKNQVTILADAAEHYHEIDARRAEAAMLRAKRRMAEQTLSEEEYVRVAASLERSLARIKVARKHSHRANPITGEGVLSE